MGSSSRLAARRGLALAVLAGALAACRAPAPAVTALRVVTTWTDVVVDQLEFNVVDGNGKPLFSPPRRLPAQPRGPLTSGADVVIYLPDSLGDRKSTRLNSSH